MALLAKLKRPRQWLPKDFGATTRWLESTLEVVRWEKMRQAGRRWGWWGGGLGALLGLLMFAPAAWLADDVAQRTGGRILLVEAQGTIWSGDAVVVLTGGPGSRDARALPGRLSWRLRPHGLGVRLLFSQDCCLPMPTALVLKPGWGRVLATLGTDLSQASPQMQAQAQASGLAVADEQGVVGQWPAAWLVGLGTPWNTLQLSGMLRLQGHGLSVEWVQGRLVVNGQADLTLQDVGSPVTTLDRLGSYRLSLIGSGQGPMSVSLNTEDGALQLQGSGSLGPSGMRFQGEAWANEAEQGALNNLLNIIGRRVGDRSIISIG